LLLFLAAGYVAISAPAKADLLYDNGPLDGNFSAWAIGDDGSGQTISDSFILNTDAVVGIINFAVWTGGSGVSSVNWAITTSPFDTSSGLVAKGTGYTTSTLNEALSPNLFAQNIYWESFATSGVSLAANTQYWLQLSGAEQDGVGAGAAAVFWDENDGPSLAFVSPDGSPPGGSLFDATCGQLCPVGGQSGSETFQLLITPEPGTVTMLLSGLLLLGGAARYKTVRRKLPQAARMQPRD
jgi:hypothetical protein